MECLEEIAVVLCECVGVWANTLLMCVKYLVWDLIGSFYEVDFRSLAEVYF